MKKFIALAIFVVIACYGFLMIPQLLILSYTPVKAFRAGTAATVSTVQASGTLSAASKRDICFGCPVKISKYDVAVGQKVAAGQHLFDVDSAVTLQALQDKAGTSTQNTENSQNASSSGETDSGSAAQAQEKLQQALSSGIIGQDTYDALMQKVEQAAGTSSPSASSSSGTADASEEEDTAVATLSYVVQHLTAPVSGVITAVNDSGTFIPSGETIVEISDLDTIVLDTHVAESQIEEVKIGQQALVTGDGFSGTFAGRVTAIAPTADSSSESTGNNAQNTVEVSIELDGNTGALKPGMSANATIRTSDSKHVVMLPYDSVKQDSDGTEYVYIFQNGRAVRCNITVSDENDSGVFVKSGIRTGDVILENPPSSIQNGSNVRIQR